MLDPYTDATAKFEQKTREIAADLILAGEAQPPEALNRARSLAQAYFAKRVKLAVVSDSTPE